LLTSTDFTQPIYLYAACVGGLGGGYALKDSYITAGSIGGALLAMKIASLYLVSVSGPSEEEKRYNISQRENEKDIVEAKESEKKQKALLDDMRYNIQDAFSSIVECQKRISHIQMNVEEACITAKNIHKVVSGWKKYS
jgi:hypothetical protein